MTAGVMVLRTFPGALPGGSLGRVTGNTYTRGDVMMRYTMTTVNDLRNWVDGATANWDDRTDEQMHTITEAIRAMDTPAWGEDWGDFLASLPELTDLLETPTDDDEPTPEVAALLARIEAAAGDYAVSHTNPCGLAAYYDAGAARPWRVADDHTSETFATAEEAESAAEAWGEGMANE